jgi:hypothetical protein
MVFGHPASRPLPAWPSRLVLAATSITPGHDEFVAVKRLIVLDRNVASPLVFDRSIRHALLATDNGVLCRPAVPPVSAVDCPNHSSIIPPFGKRYCQDLWMRFELGPPLETCRVVVVGRRPRHTNRKGTAVKKSSQIQPVGATVMPSGSLWR